jgi:cytochrome c-type biogenesis protein CcmE
MSEDSWLGTLDILRSPVALEVVAVWALVCVAAVSALFTAARMTAAGRRPYSLKLDVSLMVVGVAAGWIFWSSLQPAAEYYKMVDEVVANSYMMRDRRMHLLVHGRIVPGSIEQRKGTHEYRFEMESCEPRPCATLKVHYTGWVPDTFVSGNEIIAKGSLDADCRLRVVPDCAAACDTVGRMAKSVCPVSKTQFLDKAEAVKIVIGNSELVADKREFSTGSFGWYHNGKISITVDGKPLSVQVGINLTVVGSKEAER